MPIYEYQCTSCGHDFDKLQKIGADAPPCPKCAGEVRKKVSASAFVLKGSGWYRDHYGLKKSDKPAAEGGVSTSGGDAKAGSASASSSTSATESSGSSTSAKASSSEG